MEIRTDKYGLFDIKAGQTKKYNLNKIDYQKLKRTVWWHRKHNGLNVTWQKIGNFVKLTGGD